MYKTVTYSYMFISLQDHNSLKNSFASQSLDLPSQRFCLPVQMVGSDLRASLRYQKSAQLGSSLCEQLFCFAMKKEEQRKKKAHTQPTERILS